MKERYKGMMVGLAVGDALGQTLKFKKPKSFDDDISDMIGGGVFNLPPGKWGNCTSMALCIADSLIVEKAYNPQDIIQRFWRYYTTGYNSSMDYCFDLGITTITALKMFAITRNKYAGRYTLSSNGNGSLVRLAPIIIKYHNNVKDLAQKAFLSSNITHGSRLAVMSCIVLAFLLKAILKNENKKQILSEELGAEIRKKIKFEDLPFQKDFGKVMIPTGIKNILKGSYKYYEPPDIVANTKADKTLEAALWAFYTTDNFEDCVLKAINLGVDSDSVGAVTGQIAGAFYGYSNIPQKWKDILYRESEICEIVQKLAEPKRILS